MKIKVLLLLVLTACSTEPPGIFADGFEEYVTRFNGYAKDYGSWRRITNVTIRFGDVKKNGPNVVGTCYLGQGRPLIEIDKNYWEKTDDYGKEVIIFHEAGHCVPPFDQHRDEVKSIMNSYLPWDYVFLRDYYLNEFFRFEQNSSFNQKNLEIQVFDEDGTCGYGVHP